MHPQHMQSPSVLHLPLATAMTGQVATTGFEVTLRPAKQTHVLGKCAPLHKVTDTKGAQQHQQGRSSTPSELQG